MTEYGRESRRLSSLYVCYLSLSDPLTETQVVAYLEGLAASGHRIHLLSFEPRDLTRSEADTVRRRLRDRGITWHRSRYRKKLSLLATIVDVVIGSLRSSWLVHRHRLDLVHARSHVPAAMALAVRLLTQRPFIFDIRGLMAEEYVDAGRWKMGGVPFRLTKAVEGRALRRAAGAVVLTEGARSLLFPAGAEIPLAVIPCCVDLANFGGGEEVVGRRASPLGHPVFAYVGKFSGWYMAREMAELFAQARRRWPDAHFLILTQGARDEIEAELRGAGVPASSYTITSAAPDRVGEVLESADVGLSLIRPVPSKVASSPTKNAEYLAAGLPLIATAGVAGTDDLIADAPEVVVGLRGFNGSDFEAALDRLAEWMEDAESPARCRAAARKFSLEERGIPSYARLYREIGALR